MGTSTYSSWTNLNGKFNESKHGLKHIFIAGKTSSNSIVPSSCSVQMNPLSSLSSAQCQSTQYSHKDDRQPAQHWVTTRIPLRGDILIIPQERRKCGKLNATKRDNDQLISLSFPPPPSTQLQLLLFSVVIVTKKQHVVGKSLSKRGKFSLSKFPLRNCFRNWIRKRFLVEAEFSSVASPGQSTAVGRESREEDKKGRQTVREEEEVKEGGGGEEGGLFRAAKNKAN